MTDIQQGLIAFQGKKSSREYKRKIDECELKVRTLRNKNNQLQRQTASDIDTDIRHAIKLQASFLEKEIKELKDILQKLARDYTDPTSKTKIKQLWNAAGKQMQRNKRLMAEFVNRASTNPSFLRMSSQYSGNYQIKNDQRHKNIKHAANTNVNGNKKQFSSLVQGDELDDGQLTLQARILAQKKALLNQIQQKNNKINRLYNQMGSILGGEQRDMLNQIEQNNIQTKQNLKQGSQQLKEAAIQQKKAKKKYYIMVTAIILVILMTVAIIYLFVK